MEKQNKVEEKNPRIRIRKKTNTRNWVHTAEMKRPFVLILILIYSVFCEEEEEEGGGQETVSQEFFFFFF